MKKKKLGDLGEQEAASYLGQKGYRILARNFHSRFGEVDIVAQEGKTLVFVEVKTRWSEKYGPPEAAITPWKIRRIIKAGQYYKLLHPKTPNSLRIDVVAVDIFEGNLKEVRLIKNITQGGL